MREPMAGQRLSGPEAPLWTRNFILIAATSGGATLGNYFFSSTLSMYTEMISGSIAYSGLAVGVFSLVALAMRPMAGRLSDRFNKRSLMILATMLCSLACFLHLFALTLPVLVICRILHGMAFSVSSTVCNAAAADIIPEKRFNEGMGYYSLYVVIAAAVGPLIALFIVADKSMGQFWSLFILAGILCLICCICGYFINPNVLKKNGGHQPTATPAEKAAAEALLPPTYLGFETASFLPACILCMNVFGYSAVISYLAMFGAERGWANVGSFFTVYAVSMFCVRILSGKVADRFGADCVIIPATILGAISLVLIPQINSFWALCCIAIPFGAYTGVTWPALNVIIIKRCSAQRHGAASAAYYAAFDIGMGGGAIVAGLLVSALGFTKMYYICAGICVVSLVLYIFLLSSVFRRPKTKMNTKNS